MSTLEILKVKQTRIKAYKDKNNSYGYRCEEFDSYNWSDCVLFLGCSHVYGLANSVENSIPYLCSSISGVTSINMGISGGGPDTVLHNSFALIEKNYIPKCVVILWPEITRHLYYMGDEMSSGVRTLMLGAWSEEEKRPLWEKYITHAENYMTKSYLMASSVNKAWQLENTKVLNFNIRPKGSTKKKEVPIVYPFPMLPEPVDKAVDGIHLGTVTNQNSARFITKYY